MLTAIAVILIALTSFVVGVFTLVGYMVWRLMRNAGWDKSNMTNALRVLSHVIMHPEDLSHMYYTKYEVEFGVRVATRRPFWYIDQDEITQVVTARPTAEEKSL